jgi:hypothetical protein
MKHSGHRDENTYRDSYAPRNPGIDGQGSHFGDKSRSVFNDRFRSTTLSHNPDLWQSLKAEKQNELEDSPEFIAIGKELEDLPLESRDRRKELRAQTRKLAPEELRKCQRFQQRGLSSKADKGDKSFVIGHHCVRFHRIRGLMPEHDRLASNLFIVAPIRSGEGRAVLRDMI